MSEEHGYIYRVANADATQVQTIIAQHIGNGRTFGGAAQWDFDTSKGRENLRPIKQFTGTVALDDLKGDFGHAFSEKAEVRWKRRDDGAYDVLILSEKEQHVDGAVPLHVQHWNNKTRSWENGDWTIRRPDKAAIQQTAGRSPITYIDYLAPNGAVQFQRLVGEK
jgi:hypothetical protein